MKVTSEPLLADFLLAHGTEALGQGGDEEPLPVSLETMKEIMRVCAPTGKPMVLANPDLVRRVMSINHILEKMWGLIH